MKEIRPMLFTKLKGYTKEQLPKDVIAGIIVAIIALPLSIALALASGVGPEQGIYTAIIAGFIISLLGGSSVQIAGPTAAFATIVAGIVAKNGFDGLVVATVIAGIILIIMGLCKLGSLIKYIPFTITTGFTSGIAVTILIGQLKDFFGVTYPAGMPTIETMEKLRAFFAGIGTVNFHSVIVGVVSLGVLIVMPKLSKKIPGSLVAVIVGALMVMFLPLKVNTIGDLYTISNSLPTFHIPPLSFEMISTALPSAFTIAVLAAIESLLSCVVADGMVGEKHRSNTELVAQGAGNIASALFGGIPATGAIARTAANIKNGGRSPVSGMVHSLTLLLILVALMPYASLIPMPTIAAILFVVAYNMCHWKTFVQLVITAPKSDIAVLIITFALTVVFDLVIAIEVGMVLACVLFMKRMSDESNIRSWKTSTEDDQEKLRCISDKIKVYEISGPMFFGSADQLSGIQISDKVKCLIMRMRGVPAIDSTAMNTFKQLCNKYQSNGITIILSHVNSQPEYAMKKAGVYDLIGQDFICPDIDSAIKRAEEII